MCMEIKNTFFLLVLLFVFSELVEINANLSASRRSTSSNRRKERTTEYKIQTRNYYSTITPLKYRTTTSKYIIEPTNFRRTTPKFRRTSLRNTRTTPSYRITTPLKYRTTTSRYIIEPTNFRRTTTKFRRTSLRYTRTTPSYRITTPMYRSVAATSRRTKLTTTTSRYIIEPTNVRRTTPKFRSTSLLYTKTTPSYRITTPMYRSVIPMYRRTKLKYKIRKKKYRITTPAQRYIKSTKYDKSSSGRRIQTSTERINTKPTSRILTIPTRPLPRQQIRQSDYPFPQINVGPNYYQPVVILRPLYEINNNYVDQPVITNQPVYFHPRFYHRYPDRTVVGQCLSQRINRFRSYSPSYPNYAIIHHQHNYNQSLPKAINVDVSTLATCGNLTNICVGGSKALCLRNGTVFCVTQPESSFLPCISAIKVFSGDSITLSIQDILKIEYPLVTGTNGTNLNCFSNRTRSPTKAMRKITTLGTNFDTTTELPESTIFRTYFVNNTINGKLDINETYTENNPSILSTAIIDYSVTESTKNSDTTTEFVTGTATFRQGMVNNSINTDKWAISTTNTEYSSSTLSTATTDASTPINYTRSTLNLLTESNGIGSAPVSNHILLTTTSSNVQDTNNDMCVLFIAEPLPKPKKITNNELINNIHHNSTAIHAYSGTKFENIFKRMLSLFLN